MGPGFLLLRRLGCYVLDLLPLLRYHRHCVKDVLALQESKEHHKRYIARCCREHVVRRAVRVEIVTQKLQLSQKGMIWLVKLSQYMLRGDDEPPNP